MSGNYFKQIGEKKKSKVVKIAGILINITSSIIGFLWFVNIGDIFTVLAIGLSILAFLYYGLKISSLSLLKLVEKYDNRRLNKIRFGKIIQFVILIIIGVIGLIVDLIMVFRGYF